MIGELNFAVYLAFGEHLSERPLIGSEMSKDGTLSRNIENYRLLRENLKNGKKFDGREFMPRIPKDKRDKMDFLSWMHISDSDVRVSIPFFLQNWAFSKKTCLINKSQIIPLINPAENNYLNHLPYSCFLLRLREPVEFKDDELNHKVQNFIFQVVDNLCLEILVLPNNFESDCLTQEEEDKIIGYTKELQKYGKNNKLSQKNRQAIERKILDFLVSVYDRKTATKTGIFNVSVLLENGSIMFENPVGEINAVRMEGFNDAKTYNSDSLAQVVFLANGLGKLFSDLEPAEINHLTDINPDDQNTEKQEEIAENQILEIGQDKATGLSWNELFYGQVRKVILEKKDGTPRIKSITGGEKSPHLRRRHVRRFFDDNGAILKTVWVREMIIRKDKLLKSAIRGSSLEIRN